MLFIYFYYVLSVFVYIFYVFCEKIDGDRILAVLSQALPKKLKLMIINDEISNISDNSFDNLMKNWRGPKLFRIIRK